MPVDLVHRIHAAVADAGQAEGLLRESLGGGAAELRDVRLMASGIPLGPNDAHLHADSRASARVFTRLGFRDAGDLDVYAAP